MSLTSRVSPGSTGESTAGVGGPSDETNARRLRTGSGTGNWGSKDQKEGRSWKKKGTDWRRVVLRFMTM